MPFSKASRHWFTPSEVAQRDPDSLADEFQAYLTRLASVRPLALPKPHGRAVYVSGGTWSDYGLELSLALAKRSHLLVDVLEILPETGPLHRGGPELFALEVAGLPCERHERRGSAVGGLITHLMNHTDVVAVVVEYADFRRYGQLHLQEALLPLISGTGLPTVFSGFGEPARLRYPVLAWRGTLCHRPSMSAALGGDEVLHATTRPSQGADPHPLHRGAPNDGGRTAGNGLSL